MHVGTPAAKPETAVFARYVLTAALIATPAFASTSVTGRWITNEKDSVVEIAPCGPKLCGKIARLLKPVEGGPAVDRHNPVAALRTRPIVGMPILIDFAPNGTRFQGRIYDPRNGKTYKSFIAANPDGTLKVQGCIAFLCQSFAWTRAS